MPEHTRSCRLGVAGETTAARLGAGEAGPIETEDIAGVDARAQQRHRCGDPQTHEPTCAPHEHLRARL